MKASLFLVENCVYGAHQGAEVTRLRVISKAKPAKTDVVFFHADTSYQSSQRNSPLDLEFSVQITDPITPATVRFTVTF